MQRLLTGKKRLSFQRQPGTDADPKSAVAVWDSSDESDRHGQRAAQEADRIGRRHRNLILYPVRPGRGTARPAQSSCSAAVCNGPFATYVGPVAMLWLSMRTLGPRRPGSRIRE